METQLNKKQNLIYIRFVENLLLSERDGNRPNSLTDVTVNSTLSENHYSLKEMETLLLLWLLVPYHTVVGNLLLSERVGKCVFSVYQWTNSAENLKVFVKLKSKVWPEMDNDCLWGFVEGTSCFEWEIKKSVHFEDVRKMCFVTIFADE